MNDTLQAIYDYNSWAAGLPLDNETVRGPVVTLSLDPVNLPEFGAVIDLPFVRAESASR